MTTLKLGSRGQEVKTLQKKLKLIEDGIFGPLTLEAVLQFQKKSGLSPDGIVGPKTWEALGYVLSSVHRTIKEIIVHCSATPEGENFTVDDIRRWHKQRGFTDIGYHFVVYRDGSVHSGRPLEKSGAHTSGHNTNSIGICYIGGCAPRSVKGWNSKAVDTRTPQQKQSLLNLIKELKQKFPGNIKVYGHRDFAAKPCPSFDAKTEYANL